MKKIYLLLVALVAAMSVNAAVDKLYLIGELAGGWSANKGTEMTKVADGVFTLDIEVGEIENTHFGFASQLAQSEDDWDTLKSNRYGSSSNNIAANIGDNTMQKGDNTWTITPGHYTFTVNTNTMIFTVKEYGSQPDYRFAVHGNVFTGGDWEDRDLTYADGIWSAKLTVVAANGSFGIKKYEGSNATWFAAPQGNTNVVLDKALSFTSTDCANFNFAGNEAGTYTFTINEIAQTITISRSEEEEEHKGTWKLVSNIFDGSSNEYEMEEADGKWVYTAEVSTNGEFTIVLTDEDGNEVGYGSPSVGAKTRMNVPLALQKGNTPYVFDRYVTDGNLANYKSFRFIVDPMQKTVMVLRVGAPIYMLGTVDQDTWNVANTKHELTNVPGTNRYYSDFVTFSGDPNKDGKSYFLFTSTPGSSEGDWDTANIGRYSPGTANIDLNVHNFSYQMVKTSNDCAFSVATGTVMRAVIDLDTRLSEFYTTKHLVPDVLYLHGDLWKHRFDWSGLHGAVRKDNGDETSTYTFEGMLIEDHGNGRGYFTLSNWCKNGEAEAMMLAESADGTPDVSELAANGHAYTNASTVLLKNTYTTPEEALIEVDPNRYYNITVRLNNNGTVNSIKHEDVTDSITTGVEGVEAEDADATVEYYNMQGMRVAQPKSGIYIRRQGNTVSKVIFGGK
ncbi:MAG: hypothetical protein K2F78_02430 [Muribaculaceae bacterium]|nr:hypothetical protein [Muribaculaceae bacterium]